MTPSKKSSFNEKMLSKSIRLLEEDETEQVEHLISDLTRSETTLFELIKLFLSRLALNYKRQWYEFLDDVDRNFEDFCTLAPIIICYLELKFSNYKLEIESQNSDDEDLDRSIEPRNSKMDRLIFYTIEFENLCENILRRNSENSSENNQDIIKTLLARTYSLNLYASCNFHYLDLSSEYYETKICEQLEGQSEGFIIGISKIFQVITKESIREFLKQNKKNNIFKLNNRIEKFFNEGNYQLVIESLQDFAETHKLPLDNSKFNPKIFSYFIKSLTKPPNGDEVKCAYFCRKFLKDCIHYLKEEIRNLALNQSLEQSEITENENVEKFGYLSDISVFICDILDILYSLETSNKEDQFETDYESENIRTRESIWLMNQIMSIYFDSSNDLAIKLDIKAKPLKAFFILFDIIEKKNSKLNTAEYLLFIHEYLARNGFCGCNGGEFLTFGIEKLIKFKLECEFCSTNKNLEIYKREIDEETNKSDKTSTKGSDDDKNICLCSDFDELLEQFFYCLFGFRKKSAKHLKNHSRITKSFDVNNCWNLYYFYQPNKFPEYDDLPKFSLTSEINDLMRDILVLITGSNIDDELDKCTSEFIQKAHDFDSLDQVLDYLSKKYNKNQEAEFKDIYYYLGDYNFKIEKEKDRKNRFIYNYFIKDLLLNKDRVDSWATLGLYKSSETLLFYTESGKIIKTEADVNEFMSEVELSIVFFRKAAQYRRPNDHTFLVEFGLFLYQMSSLTSRLLRMNRLIGFFENEKIKKELEEKKIDYLKLANEAYQQLFTFKVKVDQEPINQDLFQQANLADEASLASSSSEKKSKKDQSEYNFEEEWLQNYMLGKIKEKLKAPIMESLKHYKQAYEILDQNISIYLKKITYKSKSCYNLEANEMFYRIYTLTLKRLEDIVSKPNCEHELSELSNFLENLVDTRFVKAHNDFDLDEISMFLHENVFSSSQKLNDIEHKDLFLNCVCICVTGLGQILKRFSQHYRSLYRLAFFYTKFFDFKNLEVAKNLLLGISGWNSLPYMPCSGYFQERNRANFYYGIWKISTNTNEEQQDFERAGSFSNHLFKATLLLIEVLEKTGDRCNLLDMSKMFFQKLDPEKKYLNDDMMREYIASKTITASYKNVEKAALESFRKTFDNMGEFYAYQNDLVPLLLDSFEIYKIAFKNNEKVAKFCENHLTKLYVQFNPEALNRNTPISIDEIIKFCLLIERKEKINKVKTKSRISLTPSNQPKNES
ncbi:calcineurin-binding cabin-1 isoform X1 [Brachionus plicatilis]|uniref:Calcineurin-binding cabin-1 isoform X1 n=1 Tax=Brachionus plicatilis TaxID=10195 RepID=A0A3M7SS41_BRAPC|nr:calcineurin-binding cabin-1 isoform X1 [Brachionus plicatilis]